MYVAWVKASVSGLGKRMGRREAQRDTELIIYVSRVSWKLSHRVPFAEAQRDSSSCPVNKLSVHFPRVIDTSF